MLSLTEICATRRWQLVKVLERDGQLLEKLKLSQGVFDKLEVLITRFEQQADDDAASIIASGRYQKIDSMLRSCYKSANVDYANTVSEKIDRIVTNRVLGLPIFLGIMWAEIGRASCRERVFVHV